MVKLKPTIREGQLHLIDLAGSERFDRSGSASNKKLLREAQSINKSLSCLGNVMAQSEQGCTCTIPRLQTDAAAGKLTCRRL